MNFSKISFSKGGDFPKHHLDRLAVSFPTFQTNVTRLKWVRLAKIGQIWDFSDQNSVHFGPFYFILAEMPASPGILQYLKS